MASDQHFYFKYFPENTFVSKNIFKIARPVLAALSENGLMKSEMKIEINIFE